MAPTGTVAALAFPTGNVKTFRPGGSNPYNIPWTNASRWEPFFSQAASESGVDPALIVAMAILESDANQFATHALKGTQSEVIAVNDAFGGGPSVGIMQVKPFFWQAILPDADAFTPQGNIRLGARLMANFINETGSWQNAIAQKYHPGTSGAGVTPQMYIDTIESLMAEIRAADTAQPVTQPAAPAQPVTPVQPPPPAEHPLDIITGGVPWTAEFGFGMGNFDGAGNPLNFYEYGVGHGTTAPNQHTGIDVNVPLGTVIHTPLAGVVRCVGDAGAGDWGQGCGAFGDTITGGVGNVTVLTDGGLKITFGHVNQPLVALGQRVEARQAVATSGGMLGPHLHLDVSIFAPDRVNRSIQLNGGDYFLLDPVPAIAAAMGVPVPAPGGTCTADAPPPFDGAEKVINNVIFHPDRRTVASAVEGLNGRKFADTQACLTRQPLIRGETVNVLYWIRGAAIDGEDRWWVAEDGTRIWSGGTVEKPL
jgi:murein DD-endopeptidase MepM/ murein hydrolase activator NlpD